MKEARVTIYLAALVMCLFTIRPATATTYTVEVAPGGDFSFSPSTVSIQPGDTVTWVWRDSHHTVTSGTPGQSTGLFGSPILQNGATFSFTFSNSGTFDYYCVPHGACCGMTGTVKVAGPAAAQPLNVSTRLRVQTGDKAMIGGFIVTGGAPKKVIIRALGPSLSKANISGVLANPMVTLNGSGGVISSNNDWKDTQQAAIEATGIPPSDDLESAIVTSLSPGSYTAVVKGEGDTTGVALVEVYDGDQTAASKLANISTRGAVETGSNVMIGGFILGNGPDPATVIVRGLGPSLTDSGINGVLNDPTLELRDGNGAVVRMNNNWRESQEAEINATGIAPKSDFESAIVASLAPGAYTAILAGQGGTSGIGLVEVYQIQ